MKKWFALMMILPTLSFAALPPKTLFQMAGVQPEPATLSKSVVVVIDAQREYVDGALPLAGIDDAINEGAKLLQRARAAGTPIIHVVHRGGGALFDPDSPYFAIIGPMSPLDGEIVIEKHLPNAFAGTSLDQTIVATGRKQMIVIGFMTHMCVSATVRASLDHGYATTVVATATATRDLPDNNNGMVPAATVQQATLSALADRFAVVVKNEGAIRQ